MNSNKEFVLQVLLVADLLITDILILKHRLYIKHFLTDSKLCYIFCTGLTPYCKNDITSRDSLYASMWICGAKCWCLILLLRNE